MKKILSILIALAMMLGLCACSTGGYHIDVNITPASAEADTQGQGAGVKDGISIAIDIDPNAQSDASGQGDGNRGTVGLANPMQEVTAEELSKKLGFDFKIPKGASDIKYFIYNGELGEARFKLNGIDFTARMKDEPQFKDISGMNYTWSAQNEGEIKGRPAKFMRYKNDKGCIDVVLWFDAVPGMMYSLTAEAKDLDGFDIRTVAEEMFESLQGEAKTVPNIQDGTTRVGIQTNAVCAHDKDEEIIECELYKLAVLDEAAVKALKKGGTIKLSQYGLQDIPIGSIEKKSNGAVEVNDAIMIEKNEELGGYTLRGYDDDMVKYNDGKCIVTLNKDTRIVDEMTEIAGTGQPCTSVSEALGRYGYIEATIEAKNGIAKKVTIHYHP